MGINKNFNFQTARFGIILGLFGLGTIWKQNTVLFKGEQAIIGEIILMATFCLWCLFMLLYFLKWRYNYQEALQELRHPIQNNYIGLSGVTMMLMATVLVKYYFILGAIFFFSGLIIQLAYGVFFTEQTWINYHKFNYITPSLYIPTVAGNFVSAMVAGVFHYYSLGHLFLGVGFFSWLTLESIIMNRLKQEEFPLAYKPTLGIMMAPPSIACAACLSLNLSELNLLIQCLLGYGLFHFIIFLKLFFSILKDQFNLSFWAFSFGLTTLTNITIQYSNKTGILYFNNLAVFLFVVTNLILGYLIVNSVIFLKQNFLNQSK